MSKSGSFSFQTNTRPLSLNSILVTPSIIKNLVSVRRFTKDNSCSIEFDPLGFTVKDLHTKKPMLRSDSSGDLYPLFPHQKTPLQHHYAFLASSSDTWHRRLAHPSDETLNHLFSSSALICNKRDPSHLCSACQFGKSIKHSFSPSKSNVSSPFELIHSDLWTSPVQSISGIKYYVLFLDEYSHFLWVYPLRHKSETYTKFLHFSNYIQNHFHKTIKSLQCDNGGEYNNTRFHELFASRGISFRFSCPYTSQQNGKSEG